ncbi:hypothetical protein CFP56_014069 [Quercus suber]|uniref:Uncharacterized protein n=1 Tax=Quercus suber TaxID=58331 RepID=A0AAW0KUN4_QUESU
MENFTINNKLILSLLIFVHFIIISTPGFHAELKLVETSNETLHPISPTEYPMFKAGPNDEGKLVCLPCQLCCSNAVTNKTCYALPCYYRTDCNLPGKPARNCG